MITETLYIGVDLGGTKTEVAVVDAAGNMRFRQRAATPQGDYEGTLNTVTNLVTAGRLATDAGGPVGVGMPGAISPATGMIKNANSTWLIGRPLDKDLERMLGCPVRLRNDADCFALSEAVDGAAEGAASVFGVIVGTGTGAGVVVDGRALSGPNAIAGEWGHNPLPWPQADELPGAQCYCGKTGCIETWLSGPGMLRDFRNQGGVAENVEEVMQQVAADDAKAVACLERYVDRMARGLASVINVIDPDVIVLGGGMSNIQALYQRVPQRWGRYVFSDRVATRLVPNRHGDSSGVRGAAWLWK